MKIADNHICFSWLICFRLLLAAVYINSQQAVCDRETTNDFKGLITWPDTRVGFKHIAMCPGQVIGSRSEVAQAQRKCMVGKNGYPEWSEADTTQCPFPSQITESLIELLELNYTSAEGRVDIDRIVESATDVYNLTQAVESVSAVDIEYFSKILFSLVTMMANGSVIMETKDALNKTVPGIIVGAISKLLDAHHFTSLYNGTVKDLSASSLRLIGTLEKLAKTLSTSPNEPPTVISTRNVIVGLLCPNMSTGILFEVMDVEKKMNTFNGENFTSSSMVKLTQSNRAPTISNMSVSFFIPRSAVQMANKQQEQHSFARSKTCPTPLTQFIYYKHNGFFLSREPSLYNGVVISGVLSSQLGNRLEIVNLPEPVEMTFELRRELVDSDDVGCYFWNTKENKASPKWSPDGCRLIGKRQPTLHGYRFTCHCDHLTHFALVVLPGSYSKPDGLSEVSFIGCALSMLGLLVTILATLKRKKRLPQRGRVRKQTAAGHLNILLGLCISLLLSQVMLIASILTTHAQARNVCKMTGLLLHYFLLQSFIWMTTEAMNVYFKLVCIRLDQAFHRRLSRGSLISAITLPAAIIAITMAISRADIYDKKSHCWFNSPMSVFFLASFYAPLAMCVLVNSSVLVATVCSVSRSVKRVRSYQMNTKKKYKGAIRMTRATFSLSFLTGITWTIGLVLLASESDILQYVFVILNSTQGLLIFVFHATIARHSSAVSSARRQSTEHVLVVTTIFNILKRHKFCSSKLLSSQNGRNVSTESDVGKDNMSIPTHHPGRRRVAGHAITVKGMQSLSEDSFMRMTRHGCKLKDDGKTRDVQEGKSSHSAKAISLTFHMKKCQSCCHPVHWQAFHMADGDERLKNGQTSCRAGRHSWPSLPKYHK